MNDDLVGQFSRDDDLAAAERRYEEVMLARISGLSEAQKVLIDVPDRVYHASKHAGLETLDPEMGQGLGVWFQDSLNDAAHFCVSRCSNPMTGERYEDVEPSIYEARLHMKQLAVFPDESSLYSMSIHQEGDPEDFQFPPGKFNEFSGVRQTLKAAGYDGIYLLEEGTFSALDSSVIEILDAHDPIPIFNEHVRPNLSARRSDDEPFAWALE